MKNSFTVQSAVGVCALLLLFSCHKRADYEVPCKILKMHYVERGTRPHPQENYTATITYNNHGDPTDVIWDVPTTGRPHQRFHYDKKHRLIRQDYYYSPTNYEIVKIFTWKNDRIVTDTSWFAINDINNFRNTALNVDTTTYFYDSKGRIIKLVWHGNHPVHVQTYEYDANGNLAGYGLTYDNKVNFHRTNYWFMFVNRDFSVNNPRVADEYNKKGLPLIFQNSLVRFYQSEINEFEYSCDHKNH